VSNKYHGKSIAILNNIKTGENYWEIKALEKLIPQN